MDIDKMVTLGNLLRAGIKEEQLEGLDIILLPENFTGGTADSHYDAQDAVNLSKMLKLEGVKCANSYDLGLDLPTKERRSNDIWIGQLYVLNDAILPILEGVIGSLLATSISNWKNRRDLRAPAGSVHAEITIIRPEGKVEINYAGDPETLLKIVKTLDKKQAKALDKKQDDTSNQ